MISDEDRDELYRRIEHRFSPDELIELLGLETVDIMEAFYDQIFQFKLSEVMEALDGNV